MLCEDCERSPAEYSIQGYTFCLPCAQSELGYTPAEIDRITWIADGATVYALTAATSRHKPVQVNRWSFQIHGGGEHGLRPDECAALAQQIAALPALLRELAQLRAALDTLPHE